MKQNLNQIFIVVPRLVEQPTWGGDYILGFKGWSGKAPFAGLKIGQSYELFSGSKLRSDIDSTDDESFTGELGYAMDPDNARYEGGGENPVLLAEAAKADPEQVLGRTAMKLENSLVLIKFTQAKGNSFQLHKRDGIESDKWLAKPESWYYFEPGLLTLGLKKGVNVNEYKEACRGADEAMKNISELAKNERIGMDKAKELANEVKLKFNPWQFVNLVEARKDDLIDLSGGSLHHSWEDDAHFPLGNIVYELCYDVMDPVSSIRCFDKCKIKDDGSLRRLDIEDYFRFLDTDPAVNDPETHRAKAKIIFEDDNARFESLLRAKCYSMDKITLNGRYQGAFTDCRDSYHHLFAKEGEVVVSSQNNEIKLTKGHSCFIPAVVGEYGLKSEKNAEILKTFIK